MLNIAVGEHQPRAGDIGPLPDHPLHEAPLRDHIRVEKEQAVPDRLLCQQIARAREIARSLYLQMLDTAALAQLTDAAILAH